MRNILLLGLLIPLIAIAQNQTKIDSLNHLLLSSKNEEKSIILSELSEIYAQDGEADTALPMAEEALGLAKINGSIKAEAEAVSSIAVSYYHLSNTEKAKEYFLKSITLFEETRQYKKQAKNIHNLGSLYFHENEYQTSISHFKDVLKVKKIDDYPELIAETYMDIGVNYYRLGEYSKALDNYLLSKNYYDKTANNDNYKNLLNRMGVLYYSKGEYDTAIKYLLMVLEMDEVSADTLRMGTVNSNIGSIYFKNNEFENALDHYKLAKEFYTVAGENKYVISTMINMGKVFEKMNNPDSSLNMFLKAKSIALKIDNKLSLSTIDHNLGGFYFKKGVCDTALNYYFSALEYKEKIGNKNGMIMIYNSIGDVYTYQGRYSDAINYYNKSLKLALKSKIKNEIKEDYKALANTWHLSGNDAKAYDFHLLYTKYKDSIFNEIKSNQITELQTKYETEKKEKENLFLKSDNQIKDLIISRETMYITFLTGGIILIIIFLILIFWQYQKKVMAYKTLVNQNIQNAYCDRKKWEIQESGLMINEEDKQTNKEDAGKTLIIQLQKYFVEEKPYLQSTLSLDDLCKSLNSNRSYLSKAIHKYLAMNFYEFLNDYRLKEARLLLMNSEYNHISITGIGQIAGFSSRSTFYSGFKKQFGITPSYFRQSLVN